MEASVESCTNVPVAGFISEIRIYDKEIINWRNKFKRADTSINLDFETILIKKINAKRLAQRFDIVEMSLSSERINYKPHISTKIVE